MSQSRPVAVVGVKEMLETALFLSLSGEERMKMAVAYVGDRSTPPPWLDDFVYAAMEQEGWIEHVPADPSAPRERGTPIATGPAGFAIVRLTPKGRLAIETSKSNNDIALK